MTKGEFLEPALKEFVLTKESMFGHLGESVVLFEKRLSQTKDKRVKPTIADTLIFSEHKGVIGGEIKTKTDNLSRLNRQLQGYSLVCDYVWIICHDKHVEGVEQRIKRYQHHHAGIIAYTEFQGKIIGGVYREAQKNPRKSTFHALNMLWKIELSKIMSALEHPERIAERDLGVPTYPEYRYNYRRGDRPYGLKQPKAAIIRNMLSRFGEEECNRILCKFFIQGRQHPERVLTIKHFHPQQFHQPKGEDDE